METEGVRPEVGEWLHAVQRRCVECNSINMLEIHHRIARSAGEYGVRKHLTHMSVLYGGVYEWRLHDVQNLVVLCDRCHDLIDTDTLLREKYQNTYTCPVTGRNLSYAKYEESLY